MKRYEQIQRAKAMRRPFASSPNPSLAYTMWPGSGTGSQGYPRGEGDQDDDAVSLSSTIANFDFDDELEFVKTQEELAAKSRGASPVKAPKKPLERTVTDRILELEQMVAIKDEYIKGLQDNLSLYKVRSSLGKELPTESKILSLENEVQELKQELEFKPEINALENKVQELQMELQHRPTEAEFNTVSVALDKEKRSKRDKLQGKDYIIDSLRDHIKRMEEQSRQDLEDKALLQTKLRDLETVENTFSEGRGHDDTGMYLIYLLKKSSIRIFRQIT